MKSVASRLNLTFIVLMSLFGTFELLPSEHEPRALSEEPAAKPSEPSGQASTGQMDRLLEEVRSLRQDVKKLSELVEQRLATAGTQPIEKPASELPTGDISSTKVLYFKAAWAGPCQRMLPVIEQLKREGFPIQIVDVDKEKELTNRFNVQGIPNLQIVLDSKSLDQRVGFTDDSQLRKLFAKHSIKPQTLRSESVKDLLSKRVTLDYTNAPFVAVLGKLKEQLHTSITIDDKGLEAAGVTPSAPVSITVNDVPANVALEKLTSQIGLAVHISEDTNTVVLTSAQKPEPRLIVINYTVADLLVPAGARWKSSDAVAVKGALDLIDRIKESVQPESWVENGGECTLIMNEATASFVIRAPDEMHEKIQVVLESIRCRNEPVEIESVILEAIDASVFQQAGIAVSDQESFEQAKIISEEDLDRLKRAVDAGGGKALYVPKLTTNLGSITEVKHPIPDNEKRHATLHLYVRAVPTADRKSIRLNVAANPDHLASELSSRGKRIDDRRILLLDTSQKVKPGSFDKPKGRVLVAIRARLKEEVEKK